MACRFPGADSPAAFWRLLCSGTDAITGAPASRRDTGHAGPGTTLPGRAGFLGQIEDFDADFFGISPREAGQMDPQQRLMLELAWEALDDAGIPPRDLTASQTGVFAGAMWNEYGTAIAADPTLISPHTLPGGDPSIIAARVSYVLGLRGPSLTVNTACSSSLVAIHLASQSLRDGECGLAIAGGVSLMLSPATTAALSELGVLAPDGRSKAFDARADGYGRGEGAGIVVLKPLARALADGDTIYCVLRGSAVNNDGASNGLTAPSPRAQVEVLRSAYARAGTDPADVGYVEAHGTGTALGDPIEANALSTVLCGERSADTPLRIGSVKASIGHLEPASGIAGLIKVALAMHHGMMPPSAWFEQPNPRIPFDSLGLRVQRELEPWPVGEDGLLLGGVSSFGFGGTNCHVVLEGHLREPAPVLAPLPCHENGGEASDVVFLFGGQGAHWPRMGMNLLRAEPAFHAELARCDAALRPHTGWSLFDVLSTRDTGWLDRAEVAQPAIFALQIALAGLWRSWGIEPAAVAGLSMGEVAAAHVAGAVSLDQAAAIMAVRSRIVSRLSGRGTMAVAELSETDTRNALAGQEGKLWIAGAASTRQTVVTGDRGALARFRDELTGRGVRSTLIRVGYASHSPYVDEVLPELREALAGVRPGECRIPFYSSVSGERMDGLALTAEHWIRTERDPWRFATVMRRLLTEGYRLFLDTGPHPTLTDPAGDAMAADGHTGAVLPSLRRGDRGRETLLDSAQHLAGAGVALEWQRISQQNEADEPSLLVLSGRTRKALSDAATAMADHLLPVNQDEPGAGLRDMCYTAAVRRSHHEHRLAAIGSSREELADALRATARGERHAGVTIAEAGSHDGTQPVFVFSGQGSQWAGMGHDLATAEPVFRAAMEECDELARPLTGWSLLTELTAAPDRSRLADTAVAQPALLAIEVALARLWDSWGITPAAVIGHSVGELAAAHIAGALSLTEAIRIAHHRGRLMSTAAGRGEMAAVALPVADAERIADGYVDRLAIAAVNDPDSVVLAGDTTALADALRRLRADGVYCRELRVEYAFHSAQMDPAHDELVGVLGHVAVHETAIPMYSTVTGALVSGQGLDASYWAANLRRTVRFADAAGAAIADGHRLFLETGPHAVLRENIEQCLSAHKVPGLATGSLRRGQDARVTLLHAAGALHTHGCPVRFEPLCGDAARVVRLPAYPWQRERFWHSSRASRHRPPRPAAGLPHRVEWRRVGPPQPSSARAGTWVLLADRGGFAEALAERLRSRGEQCVLINEPGLVADTLQNFAEDSPPAGVVSLAGLDADPDTDPAPAIDAARSLLHALSQTGWRDVPRLWLVTRAAHVIGPEDTQCAPSQAPVWGLSRSNAVTQPGLDCTRIDLAAGWTAEDAAAHLDGELAAGGTETDIALRPSGRHAARLTPQPSPGPVEAAPLQLSPEATYLVAGGRAGQASAITGWLLSAGARHVAVSCTDEAVAASLAALPGTAGEAVQVRVLAAGPADPDGAAALIAEIEQNMPPLRGVIYTDPAGSEAPVGNDGIALVARCRAARQLDSRTQRLGLDFFVLNSLTAGLLGGQGEAADAAAGAYLTALADHRRVAGLPGLSISWDADIPASESTALLPELLAGPEPHPVVLRRDLQRWLETHPQAAGTSLLADLADAEPAAPAIGDPPHPVRERLTAAAGDRLPILERHLREQLALTLQQDPARVGRDTPFRDMGLESVLAVDLRNRLEDTLGLRLPVAVLFTCSTISELARHVLTELRLSRPEPEPGIPPAPTVADPAAGNEPIAIIGIGCRLPGQADSPEDFWQLLCHGTDAVSTVPADRADRRGTSVPAAGPARWGAFLPDVDLFDAGFFGISPREANAMDPQQRLLLEVTWEALERAGQPPVELNGTRTGVFTGVVVTDYERISQSGDAQRDIYTVTGNGHSFPAGRLSYQLGLQGPSMTVDTACSSSLVAIHLACQSLRAGESNLALAGGVNLMLAPDMSDMLAGSRALSPDGRCKTFDAKANGYVRGEGCGMVVLKRLSDAIADDDPILAVIRGSAVNSDGRSSGLTAPNVTAQQALLRQALASAGAAPEAIGYVETHGTGTPLGDPIEVAALTEVMGRPRADGSACVLGAVKTNIGHLEAAAGVAGLIKTVLALQHERIPANLHLRTPNPRITFSGTAFRLPHEPVAWPRITGRPRLAGVSSFGISGTNAHVIVGEAPELPEPPAASETGPAVVPISGRSPAAVRELASGYAIMLATQQEPSRLADIAATAALRRQHHEHRAAFVADSGAELAALMEQFAAGQMPAGAVSEDAAATCPKVVFVFPGQGSQWAGMGRELYATEPAFRDAIQACDEEIQAEAGWSVVAALHAGPGSPERIDVVQPMLFAIQLALAALWRSKGVEPDAVAGHSMGEVAAACVAGALSLRDAVRVMCRRSRLLARLSGRGAMAVTELSQVDAQEAVTGTGGLVSIAASNSPRSTVLSGDPDALRELVSTLTDAGVYCRTIKVSVASHSAQVDEIIGELRDALADLRPGTPTIPMHSTVTGRPCRDGETGPEYWVRNLRAPVLFTQVMTELAAGETAQIIELSPHPVLLPAIEETRQAAGDDGRAGGVLPSLRREQGERRVFLESLATLYTRGYPVDWSACTSENARCIPLPTYPWQRQRHWLPAAKAATPSPTAAVGEQVLLAGPIELATRPGLRIWERELSADDPGYLADHRVGDEVVLPAAACVEMMLTAARQTYGDQCVLADLAFERMIVLAASSYRVQLVLEPPAGGRAAITLFGRGGVNEEWTQHASGVLLSGEDSDIGEPAGPIQDIQHRCQEISAAEHYRSHQARSIHYGPTFQGVRRLWAGQEEALGWIEAPPGQDLDTTNHICHPAVLDACFQVLGALASQGGQGTSTTALVPAGLDGMRVGGPLGAAVWAHATLRPSAPSDVGFTGDLRLITDDGLLAGELTGLRIQPLATPGPYQDWLYEVDWCESPQSAVPDSPDPRGTWLVLADTGGTGEALAALLSESGASVAVVFAGEEYQRLAADRYSLASGDADGWDRLIDEAIPGAARCAGVVHLWSLDTSENGEVTPATLAADQQLAGLSTLRLAQAILRRGWRDTPTLHLVTRGAQHPGGGTVRVAQAPLLGFARTLSMEHPELGCTRIDLDPEWPAVTAARRLLPELLGAGAEDEIALRTGARWAPRLRPARGTGADHGAWQVTGEGTYLITGGLGGLGLRLAQWLAERGARHLALISRGSPSPQAAAAINAIRQDGTEIAVANADVTRREELAEALDQLGERMPPLRGVLHLAMVLDDRTVLDLDAEQFDQVLAPKTIGAWNLHELTLDQPLEFFVLYSSAAALLGSPGQASYASANAFLGALARYRVSIGLPALCVDWGLFAESGIMAERAADAHRLLSRGVGTITPVQGMEILEHLLSGGKTHLAAMNLDLRQWLEFYPTAATASLFTGAHVSQTEQAPAAGFAEELAAADPVRRPVVLADAVAAQLGQLLHADPGTIDRGVPFTSLGMDSLMALELRNRLEATLGVRLSVTTLFAAPTVTALAGELLRLLPGTSGEVEDSQVPAGFEHMDTVQLLAHLDKTLDDIAGGTQS